ncbi:MAG: DUF5317 domain-containing protein [Bacillota bacterium]|nr:DUF5317 domain-containing protein [Bacillota bacterium]
MLWEAVLIGLIIGWLRNGKVKNLGKSSFSLWFIMFIAIAIQILIWVDYTFLPGYLASYYPYLYTLSFFLLVTFIIFQGWQFGIVIIGIGILLNFLVIAANDGKMPVDITKMPPEAAEELIASDSSPFHTAMTEETPLAILGDRISVPYKKNQLLSIGDIILAAGVTFYIQHNMRKKKIPKH